MSIYIPNEAIVADFLRENLSDPNSNRTYLSTQESFTAGSSQSEYSLSAPSGSVSHVTSVTVDGTTKTKWKDYYWDYKAEKVIFKTSEIPSSGDSVVVDYVYSSKNWIYTDLPVKRISDDGFPRIRVFKASQQGQRLGNYKAPVESTIRFQIDIWTKEKVPYTVNGIGNGRTYSGEALAEILARQTSKFLEDNIDDIYPVLYDYILLNATYQGMNDLQTHHYVYEFSLKTSCNGIIN